MNVRSKIANRIESTPAVKCLTSDACGTLPRQTSGRFELKSALCIFASLALSGAALGILFSFWSRRCVQMLGPGSDALGSGRVVFGLGVLLGIICADFATKWRPPKPWMVPITALGAMSFTVLGQHLVPVTSRLVSGMAPYRDNVAVNYAVCLAASAVLMLSPALAFGALNRLLIANLWNPSKKPFLCGSACLLNICCIALGAIAASLWLMPLLGGLGALASALILMPVLLISEGIRNPDASRVISLALLLSGLAVSAVGNTPGALKGDRYLYGQNPVPGDESRLLEFKTARSADIQVIHTPTDMALQVDGITVGGSTNTLPAELGLALLPRLLRVSASRVLVLGLGSGATCAACRLFPDTKILCVESEPAIISASRAFGGAALPPTNSIAFSIAVRDERAELDNVRDPYDLLLVDHGDPRIVGTSQFMTREFYAAARKALSERGILAQRLRLDSFTSADFARLARTVTRIFPNCALAAISDSDCVLLASASALMDSRTRVEAAQRLVDSKPSIQEALLHDFETTDVAGILLRKLWLGDSGLRRLASCDSEVSIFTDWNPAINPSGRRRAMDPQFNRLLIGDLLASATDENWFEQVFTRCGCTKRHVAVCHQLAEKLGSHRLPARAAALANWALKLDPSQPELLADSLIWSADFGIKQVEELVDRITNSVTAVNRIGMELSSRHKPELATIAFRRAVLLAPRSTSAWANLGRSYLEAGHQDKAADCFQRALTLDPLNEAIAAQTAALSKARGGGSASAETPKAVAAEDTIEKSPYGD